MLFRKANPTQTRVQPAGSEADQESLLLGGVVILNFLNFLEDGLSSLSLWSLSCLRLDLLCLAGDLVLDLLDLGDHLLVGACLQEMVGTFWLTQWRSYWWS